MKRGKRKCLQGLAASGAGTAAEVLGENLPTERKS